MRAVLKGFPVSAPFNKNANFLCGLLYGCRKFWVDRPVKHFFGLNLAVFVQVYQRNKINGKAVDVTRLHCFRRTRSYQLALSFADEAYDEMDKLKNSADSEALKALVRQLIDVSQRMM